MNDEIFFQNQIEKLKKWFRGINISSADIKKEAEPIFYQLLDSYRQGHQEILQAHKAQMSKLEGDPVYSKKEVINLRILVENLSEEISGLNQAICFYLAVAYRLNRSIEDLKGKDAD